jgi:hypothetical protein
VIVTSPRTATGPDEAFAGPVPNLASLLVAVDVVQVLEPRPAGATMAATTPAAEAVAAELAGRGIDARPRLIVT